MTTAKKKIPAPPSSTSQAPSTRISAATNVDAITDQLSKITHQIYEQNVELSVRNRTLSLLRQIYQIISTSLGIRHTAQLVAEDIIKELGFQAVFISVTDKRSKQLNSVAVALNKEMSAKHAKGLSKALHDMKLSLKQTDNYCVQTANHNEKRMTNFLVDVLTPSVNENESHEFQTNCNIQTTLLFPIVFANQVLGVIGISLAKHIGFLSRGEREALHELVEVVAIAIERAQIYSALKHANERLKELDILKDEFVSIASHELRTPMTAIKSYLWMALNKSKQKLDPQLQKYLDISYKSTERLIHLVNDMLTVSRIERNKIELKIEKMDVYDVAQQVYDELKIKADERRILFTLQPEKSGFWVKGDKEKMREVIQNIVGNALKFTPEDGKISIVLAREHGMVSVTIADTGPGICKEDLGKLFQKFQKLERSYTQQSSQPGSGLGLYISKQIVEMHKGTITVHSELDVGTTFTVTIPALRT